MGPIAVKTYSGEEWKPNSNRATFESDYGRRGKLWVHGAFEPATRQAVTLLSPGRESASHVQLLEKIMAAFPAERWLIIEDNLSIHISKQTKLALAAWPEMQMQFIPKYACWLNLIEPWWKQLRSLALKGRRFENLDQLTQALTDALDYWNKHHHPYSWNKRPQEQVEILGGFCVQFRSDNLAIY
jgi:transposase